MIVINSKQTKKLTLESKMAKMTWNKNRQPFFKTDFNTQKKI